MDKTWKSWRLPHVSVNSIYILWNPLCISSMPLCITASGTLWNCQWACLTGPILCLVMLNGVGSTKPRTLASPALHGAPVTNTTRNSFIPMVPIPSSPATQRLGGKACNLTPFFNLSLEWMGPINSLGSEITKALWSVDNQRTKHLAIPGCQEPDKCLSPYHGLTFFCNAESTELLRELL